MSKAVGASEKLAVDGGTPVRKKDWPGWPQVSEDEWRETVGPALKEVYLSRTEGLPAPKAKELACNYAGFVGTKYAVMTPHGTDAIMAAVAGALDIDGIGDAGEVICPNYTFVATASAPLSIQCRIAFADVSRTHFTLDPEAVEAMIGPNTAAILPVHLGGHPADMEALKKIADKHGLKIIEDCAQSHGAEHTLGKVGSMGDVGGFSFQSSKNLTSGEGGMVTTDDKDVYERVYSFLDVGRRPGGERWEYPRLGWNYRTSEYLAALLNTRLGLLPQQLERRSTNAAYLSEQLGAIEGITPPQLAPWVKRHAYHLYMCTYDSAAFGGHSRDEFLAALRAEGIPCSPGYVRCLSDEAGFQMVRERYPDRVRVQDSPNTQWCTENAVWLFQNLLLDERESMDDVVAAFHKIKQAWAS